MAYIIIFLFLVFILGLIVEIYEGIYKICKKLLTLLTN